MAVQLFYKTCFIAIDIYFPGSVHPSFAALKGNRKERSDMGFLVQPGAELLISQEKGRFIILGGG